MSAIFDSIASPFDRISRHRKGAFVIEYDDIESLYYRVIQTMDQYNIKGQRCEFVFSTDEGGIFKFTSIEKLASANLNALTKAVRSLSVLFDILIFPPEKETISKDPEAQRFKLSLTIEDPVKIIEDSEEYRVLGINIQHPDYPTANISIDYSDYAVSRTLLAIAEEWLEGLKGDTDSVLSPKSRKIMAKIGESLPAFFPISVLIGALIFEPEIYPSVFTPIRYLLFVILLVIGGIALSVYTETRITRLLGIISPKTTFLISSKDQKNRNDRVSLRKRAIRKIVFIFTGIVVATLIGVFANYISSQIILSSSNSV